MLKSLLTRKDDRAAAGHDEDGAAPVQPLQLTAATFDEALRSDLPVLVDFWAPWCGPCRMLAPTVEGLAQDYQGRMVVAKLNTDENGDLVRRLGIMGIPALILFRDGREVDRYVGYAPRKVLQARLDAALDGGAG